MSRLAVWYSILNGTYDPQVQPVTKLDGPSKYLIATRSVVFVMTINSVIIGTLLSLLYYGYNPTFLPYLLLVIIGLTFSHAASNLFNDYWDAKHGIDTSQGYFRPAYLPHPTISGMMHSSRLVILGAFHIAIMVLIATYFTIVRGPVILLFTFTGIFLLLVYAGGPLTLKRVGLGEPAVFMVWGPLMVGGTFFVLTGRISASVILDSFPYALVVTSVLVGKHIDKLDLDRSLGVRTLPVLLGEYRSRILLITLIVSSYVMSLGLALAGVVPIYCAVVLLALPRAISVVQVLNKPKPVSAPTGYRLWPIWFLGYVFWHNRRFGMLYIVGLALGLLFPAFIKL